MGGVPRGTPHFFFPGVGRELQVVGQGCDAGNKHLQIIFVIIRSVIFIAQTPVWMIGRTNLF